GADGGHRGGGGGLDGGGRDAGDDGGRRSQGGVMSDAPLVIRGGMVVDATGTRRVDVGVHGGLVTALAPEIDAGAGTIVLDAGGCIVAPGLVDLHAHLREPGGEAAETVETGSRAGALGGYTAVVAMPNTEPAIDSAAVVRQGLAPGSKGLCGARGAGRI